MNVHIVSIRSIEEETILGHLLQVDVFPVKVRALAKGEVDE
jgi:hypothetical protein